MREYVLIMLNTLEYFWIYLNKQSFEYTRILNVSDAVKIFFRCLDSVVFQFDEHFKIFMIKATSNCISYIIQSFKVNFSVIRNDIFIKLCAGFPPIHSSIVGGAIFFFCNFGGYVDWMLCLARFFQKSLNFSSHLITSKFFELPRQTDLNL